MSQPIALIFGAGANVGARTVSTFLAQGYRVAQASRSSKQSTGATESHLFLTCDVSTPEAISKAFTDVRERWGHPAVVVYNAYGHSAGNPEDPYSDISLSQFTTGLNANVVGAFQAAKEAVAGFKELPDSVPKSFFFTGNILNEQAAMSGFTVLGVGKSAAAYLMADADSSYRAKGYRFFYVDERTADGAPIYADIDGQAHADFFLGLANRSLEAPWRATFVKGVGYKKFPWKE